MVYPFERGLGYTRTSVIAVQLNTSRFAFFQSLMDDIKVLNAQNTRLTNNNDILKERVSELQDFESKHHKIVSFVSQ